MKIEESCFLRITKFAIIESWETHFTQVDPFCTSGLILPIPCMSQDTFASIDSFNDVVLGGHLDAMSKKEIIITGQLSILFHEEDD